ncbi:restriction endonuclease subunit S [Salmonella enterica subsp. enterica]|nr:restriction endonuclease subunit S [Salmonella enterica]EDT6690871.1 restriction endonuclease subunit S [Salmonella enterica subsp. enterica serovar Gbadago]EDW7722902.1 restriction endonuclease subunit S [Salmonella enterica]
MSNVRHSHEHENIPRAWVVTSIGEISDVVAGGTPRANNPENFVEPGAGVAWLTPADLSGYTEKYISRGARDLSKSGYESSSAKLIPAGSLLFSSRAPIGYVAIASNELSTSQGFKSFVFPTEVNSSYAYYFLRSIRDFAESQGTGTTFKEVSISIVKTFPFILPPLAEQKVIADKLDFLMSQVETTKTRLERILQILKHFRQVVLSAAMNGKLTDDWRKKNSSEKWKSVTLLDVIESKPRNGYSPKGVDYKTAIKNLTLSAVTKGYFLDGCFKYVDVEIPVDSHLWVKNNDILIQRANSIEHVGISAIYQGEDDQYIYPDLMMKIRANKNILTKYLHYCLLSDKTRDYFRKNASGTTGNMPKINQGIVSATPINLPAMPEQVEIVRRVDQLFTYAEKIEVQSINALKRVNNLSQSILIKAFRGELTEQWRIDNPSLVIGKNSADVMLEKIKSEREILKKQSKPQHGSVKSKTDGSIMNKKTITVVEALKQACVPLNGQQLLAAAGYPSDSSTEELEKFFLDIRESLICDKSIIKLERSDDGQDWFALSQGTTKN